ncbi:hypothetical protein D3C81_1944120 [compost metagenome]
MIGHGDPILRYRAGDGDTGILNLQLQLGQVLADHRFQAIELQTRIGFRLGDLARLDSAQRQAGIGTANITYEGIGHRCFSLK